MNSAKKHIYHVKNSRLGHDLPTLVNYRFISMFREDFIQSTLFNSTMHNSILSLIST